MLKAAYHKTENITLIDHNENTALFQSEVLNLRIVCVTDEIIRVTFTENDEFSTDELLGVENATPTCNMDIAMDSEKYTISTAKLDVTIAIANGQIICSDKTGKVLFSEKARLPHEINEFDYCSVIPVDKNDIKMIDTPDGKKQVIESPKKVFERKLYQAKMAFAPQKDEALYGLGQHTEGYFNLRNTTRYLHQANMKVVVPLMMSDNGYGILFNIYGPMIFEDNKNGAYLYAEGVNEFDYFILKGEPKQVVKNYRYLTGKASLLPMWAYGFVQSQERYETSKEMLDVVKGYRERKLGIDCVVLDWMSWGGDCWGQKTFDSERFPDPKAFTDELHEMNSRFMLSVWSTMRDCKDADEFKEAKLMLPNCNQYDAFCQEGRDLFKKQLLEGIHSKGVDSYWNDSTEPFTFEWGKILEPTPGKLYEWYCDQIIPYIPLDMANAYSLYHSKSIYDAVRSANDGKRVVNLTRSGYHGQQRYGTIVWSGDTAATWETLNRQVAEGLSFVASGHPWWTLDIGGFFVKPSKDWYWNGDYDEGNKDLGYRELYARWYQYGSFLPMFRSHGTDTRREMWLFGNEGEATYDTLVKYNRLRYTLMPTLYSIAGRVWKNDESFMTPLYFNFPNDKATKNIDNQFMVGSDIMVCPVLNAMYYGANSKELVGVAKTREVYFPAGSDWYDLETNELYKGGTTATVNADLMKIPVYIKTGGILLCSSAKEYASEWVNDSVTVNVYDGENGSFEWYLDAGDGYEYEKGEYAVVNISYNNEHKEVVVSDTVGSYANMPQSRKLTVKIVGTDNAVTIDYTGAKTVISF